MLLLLGYSTGQNNLMRKGFISFIGDRPPWREAKVGVEAEYSCLAYGFLRLLYYTTQDHVPRDSPTHGGFGPPMSITSQENVPHTWPQANVMAEIPYLRFLLLRVTLVLVTN